VTAWGNNLFQRVVTTGQSSRERPAVFPGRRPLPPCLQPSRAFLSGRHLATRPAPAHVSADAAGSFFTHFI